MKSVFKVHADMQAFRIALLGLLYSFASLALASKCPHDATSKLVVCYYASEISLADFNVCNCTHVVFTNAVRRTENNSFIANEDTIRYLKIIKGRKENLATLFTLETKRDETSVILKLESRVQELVDGIVNFLQKSQFDGVELNFKFSSDDGVSEGSYASFVKTLSKTLSSHHRRVKREGYDVFEKLQDDITTVTYTTQTPKNSTSRTQSIKQKSEKPKENSRKIREKADDVKNDLGYHSLEETVNSEFLEENSNKQNTLKDVEEAIVKEKRFFVFVRLSINPEIIVKKYDLKTLSSYADILTVPTHDIVDSSEEHLTYHPSRLMGLSDILNIDSILDFLTGMGASKSKIVISFPATVLKFQLKDKNKSTPRSPTNSKPQLIDQSQLCALFSKNNWTIERDDDLTAPYAFSEKNWLAFEDETSINIKGKYILLRELAGGAIYTIDSDLNDGLCTNRTGSGGYLTGVLHKNFESLERKSRASVLEILQDEIHNTAFTNLEAGVKLSEYRIVRVVDHSGAVHVIRKNTKTQFECSRQGYFSHPLGCNKFYRCVKFDQSSDDFTVFEYNCPTGLAFDEKWEVCVWPGSLQDGSSCTGSSEIAPVPRSHYQCPNSEGYYADPENCRWFFACLDHARDGVTSLTAYEFRCPFGLVFSEEKLACDWPWLVGSCGNRGSAGYLNINTAGQTQRIYSSSFLNGGNLEASLGQYDSTKQTHSFIGFGEKSPRVLKGSGIYDAEGSHQSPQSAGFGYISSQFDDTHDRASFATFPEYEISGGRIFNKGGIVLEENIAGSIGSTLASTDKTNIRGGIAGASGGLDEINIRGGLAGGSRGLDEINIAGGIAGGPRSLSDTAGYLHQENLQSFSGIHSTPNIKLQKLKPVLETSKINILETSGLSSGGQVSLQNSLSQPKPFSFGVTSGQINSGKVSGYSEYSAVKSTTPQKIVFGETPLAKNINLQLTDGKQLNRKHSISHGFTVSQPAVSVGIPVVAPKLETHAFGGVVSGDYNPSTLKADISLSTPSVSSVSHYAEPKIVIHGVGQSTLKQVEFPNKISFSPAAVTVGFPVTLGTQTLKFGSEISEAKTVSPPVALSSSLVTPKPGVHTFEYTASSQGASINQPLLQTEKPLLIFNQQNHKITEQNNERKVFGNSAVSVQIPAVQSHTFKSTKETQNLDSGSIDLGQTEVSYEAPLVTVIPSIYSSGAKAGLGSEVRLSTVSSGPSLTGFVHSSTDEKVSNELRSNKLRNSYAVPKVNLETASDKYFGQLNADAHEISNKIPVVTPKPDFQIFSQSGLNSYGVTGKSEATVSYDVPVATPRSGQNLFKSSFYGERTGGDNAIPVIPLESTGITDTSKNTFEQTGSVGVLKDFLKVSFKAPVTAPQSNLRTDSFRQTGSAQEKTSYGIPVLTSELKPGFNVQTGEIPHGFFQSKSDAKFTQAPRPFSTIQPFTNQGYSYSSLFEQSGSPTGSVPPFRADSTTLKPIIIQKADTFIPKIEHSSTLTDISIEQQPVTSTGTFTSVGVNQVVSTPKPHVISQNVFSKDSAFSNIHFKSSYVQPQPASLSSPAAVVSLTPSTPIAEQNQLPTHPLSINIAAKPAQPITFKQQKGIKVETYSPNVHQEVVSIPGNVNVQQKSQDFKQITSFTPAIQVASFEPKTYKQEVTSGDHYSSNLGFGAKTVFYDESNVSFIPVTPKSEFVGSAIQQNLKLPVVPFESTERNQILIQEEQPKSVANQHLEFSKTKSLIGEKKTEFIHQQLPIQLSTPGPEYQQGLKTERHFGPVFTTNQPYTPREELAGLEISKSIEINPTHFFKTTDEYQVSTPLAKQVVQPFYKPQNEKITAQINNIQENDSQQQFVLQDQITVSTPKTVLLKQEHFPPLAVTSKPQGFTTNCNGEKIVSAEQPNLYSKGINIVEPALPVFEAQRIPLTEHRETTIFNAKNNEYVPQNSGFFKNPVKAVFVEQHERQEVVPSKVNLLIPTATEISQHTPSQTEEILIQTHRNFDFQKNRTFGSTPGHVFIQPEINSNLKPAVNGFETLGHLFQYKRTQNLTTGTGHSDFGSGIKYSINPNIEIPEPPREYILAQNDYTTRAPEYSTTRRTESQFQSALPEFVTSRFKESNYISSRTSSPQSPSKTVTITSNNLNEVSNDKPRNLFSEYLNSKYSGRFGEVINGKNGRFGEVIKGSSRGEIESSKKESSTVRYEVSSTTTRPRSRGRQYHGGITSGIQDTDKEYEVNGGRSFNAEKVGHAGDGSKTTIDLTNLKLDKNKNTVIVVSQVSDANPVLIGKLAGQCSCQSNMLELRNKGKKANNDRRKQSKNQKQQSVIFNEYLPPFESDQAKIAEETFRQGEASTAVPKTVVIGGGKPLKSEILSEQNLFPSSTTTHFDLVSSSLPSLSEPDDLSVTLKPSYAEERARNKKKQFRGKARYLPPSALSEDGSSVTLLSPVPASEIARKFDDSVLKGDESRTQNEIDRGRSDESKILAGAAFDRYGPGGWRGFDETLQGSVDCKRPGLFRHPKHCNKFYACNYDPWKERYTLHVFNCPIHLTYDSSISACNWPVKGPACTDDNLLV